MNICISIQQKQVLHWYVHKDPPPDDALITLETLAACHLLFAQELLSHERIRALDSQVLKNISKGYEHFSGWLTSILDKGEYIAIHYGLPYSTNFAGGTF